MVWGCFELGFYCSIAYRVGEIIPIDSLSTGLGLWCEHLHDRQFGEAGGVAWVCMTVYVCLCTCVFDCSEVTLCG